MGEMILYHGSKQIVEAPRYGVGELHNDYGQGFYCTESNELAKEWACTSEDGGYSNRYVLDTDGLQLMNLNDGNHSILNWLAVLLLNRTFDITSNVGNIAKEYLLENFLPDTSEADIIIGYRADDSYSSFAEDFVNNTISVRDLDHAMHLRMPGEQIVLKSPRAFDNIEFLGYEVADHEEYYARRMEPDSRARSDYRSGKKNMEVLKGDLFMLDIIREGMTDGDIRL